MPDERKIHPFPRTGLTSWLVAEIVKRSPVRRLDLLAEAQARCLIPDGPMGWQKVRVALNRLSEAGVVLHDRKVAYWTGRALPPRGIGVAAYNRVHWAAKGDRTVLAQLRAEELAKIVARREALLWALRSADAPPIFPLPNIATRIRKPPRRKFEASPKLQAILAELKGDRLRQAHARANALIPYLPAGDSDA